MKKLIVKNLGMICLFISVNSFASWDNPNACDPDHVQECWIHCFNNGAVTGGEHRMDTYITPMKNGSAQYEVLRERRNHHGFDIYSSGTLLRNDTRPLSFELDFNNDVSVSAATSREHITENNGWSLLGSIHLGRKSMGADCSYQTKTNLEGYYMHYEHSFPLEFYKAFYTNP